MLPVETVYFTYDPLSAILIDVSKLKWYFLVNIGVSNRDERTREHLFANNRVLVLVREQEQNENIEKFENLEQEQNKNEKNYKSREQEQNENKISCSVLSNQILSCSSACGGKHESDLRW